MKRLLPFISCLLALSLGLAGFVAMSPSLHVLMEHNGEGAAHTHWGGATTDLGVPAAHTPGRPHGHAHSPRGRTHWMAVNLDRPLPGAFINNHRSFDLPSIPLERAWQAFLGWLGTSNETEEAPSDSNPSPRRHDHHSLTGTLASGLIESPSLFLLSRPRFIPPIDVPSTRTDLPRSRILDPQTAGRAPPPFLG